MFEVIEKHKRTREEKKVLALEYLAAVALVVIAGMMLWLMLPVVD